MDAGHREPQAPRSPRRALISLLIAAALLLLLLLLAFGAFDGQPPFRATAAPAPASPPAAATAAANRDVEQPRAEDQSAGATLPEAAEHEFELSATLVDRWGLPADRARVFLGPLGALCALQGGERKGDQVHVTWRAHCASLWMACADVDGDRITDLRMFEIRAGVPLRLWLGVGGPVAAAWWSVLVATAQSRLAGETRFSVPLRPFTGYVGGSSIPVPDLAASEPAGSLHGTIRGSDGVPAKEIGVALQLATAHGTRIARRTTTDAQGRFAFRNLPGREFNVRAGGGAEGIAETNVVVPRDGPTTCELQLALGSHLSGRVVVDGGHRVDGWRIVCEGIDHASFTVTVSAADGAFVVPLAEGAHGRLLLWPPDDGPALPVRTIADVTTGGGELLVAATVADPASGFQVRVPQWLTPDGEMRAPFTEVFLFQEESGRGVLMEFDASGSGLAAHGVVAGWYRVVGATQTHGCFDLGRQWCDGHQMVDLGMLDLPELATVRFLLPANEKVAPELCQIRDDIDLRIDGLDLTAADGVRLPSGSYVVHWQEGDAAAKHRAFTVTAGQRAVVDCSR